MKRFEFNKVMVESPIPPQQKGLIWIDIDENTKRILSMKEMNSNGQYEDYTDIISSKAGGVKSIEISLEDGVPTDNEVLDNLSDGTYCICHEATIKDGKLFGTLTVETSNDIVTQSVYIPYIDDDSIAVLYVLRDKIDGDWSDWSTPD